jgi:mono/diheme cytochrome c family protein
LGLEEFIRVQIEKERRKIMKWKLVLAIAGVAVSVAFLPKSSGAADDGAALYKSKCAGCHGAQGEGKPAVKAPALKGTALTTEQIAEHVTKGEASSKPPHKKGIAGVSEAQATAIAEFIKTLK